MTFPRRLACLLLPMALLACLTARPARTQATNNDARFAFADTTLLRDTLGLKFDRLFPLADSLRMTPVALKALSVSTRWSLHRLVKMADSLDVPIDSVGPVMERERFNPLANVVTNDRMTYTSTFTPSASGDVWRNDLNYSVNRGKVFVNNDISINQAENGRGGSLGRKEDRSAVSTLNWRFSPRFALGTNVSLTRYDALGRGGLVQQKERVNNFGLSINSRPKPWMGFAPTVNFVGGVESIDQVEQQKSGPSGTLSTGLRYTAGQWISHDFNVTLKSSILRASATDPNPSDDLSYPKATARDNNISLRGTLNALRSRPVELNMNYSFSNSRIHNSVASGDTSTVIGPGPAGPETSLVVVPLTNKDLVRSQRGSMDATLRMKNGDKRSLDLTWRTGINQNANSRIVTSLNTREDQSLSAAARAEVGPFRLDGSFRLDERVSELPNRDFPRGGYREDGETRAADGKLNWRASEKLTANLESNISLNIARYRRIGSALTLPADHDSYLQEYKLSVKHDPSPRASNTVSLRVTRSQSVNLPAASTASNSDTRIYRAGWNWSYQLFEGLTATQSNNLSADYSSYPFSPTSNRLILEYTTFTTLNSVLNPRLSLDVIHQTKFRPSGNYRPQSVTDPTEVFSRSDETEGNSIRATARYQPIPAFSLAITPDYVYDTRRDTQNGVLAPRRESRSLDVSGSASLNLKVGSRGKLEGDVRRSAFEQRVIEYTSTGIRVTHPTRRSVGGSLMFTWTM